MNDSRHGYGSLHYGGSAIDYRTKHLSEDLKDIVQAEVKSALGEEFDVLLEGRGTVNEHLHVEYQPKE